MVQIFLMSTSNARLQIDSRADMRGRIISPRALTVMGSTPVGAPIVGWISNQYGPRWGLVLGGVAALGASLWFGRFLLAQRGARSARNLNEEVVSAVGGANS